MTKMQKLFNFKPKVFAADTHRGYFTSALIKNYFAVQHHAAHALSVAAEHNIKGNFLAVIYDGSGLGIDGTIWGGEFLKFGKKSWKRFGHFEYMPLPGGDDSVSKIWKLALGILGADWITYKHLFKNIPAGEIKTTLAMLKAGINCPPCSSVGRLFDLVAFLAKLRAETTYQAQAAMELEAKFTAYAIPYKIAIEKEKNMYVVRTRPMIEQILNGQETSAVISNRFHTYIIKTTVEMAKKSGEKTVVLSGGVFQNEVILEGIVKELTKNGFKVFYNEKLPCNDACTALGQAVAAMNMLR